MTGFGKLLFRAVSLIIMTVVLTLVMAGCSRADSASDDSTTLRIAVSLPEDDFRCDYIRQFQAEVEEKTEGRVSCEIYYLDKYRDQLVIYEDLKKGKIDISPIAAPYFTDLVPEEGISGLPYLFSDHNAAWEFAESDINKKVDEKLEKKGIKVLTHYCGSFRCFSNSKRPINTPDDMKGLIIGTVRSKAMIDMFTALGATAYNYMNAELYDNLNRRTYDGADWSVPTFYENEYYKIQPYVAVTNHAYNLWNFVIRKEVYDKISDADKAVVEAAAKSSAEAERVAVHEIEEDLFDKISELGVEITYPDPAPFVEKTAHIREEYSGDFKQVYEETREWLANR